MKKTRALWIALGISALLAFCGCAPAAPLAQAVTEPPPTEATEAPETTIPETQPPTTEPPKDEVFTLSFVGDLTLASDARLVGGPYSFSGQMNGDFSYPLKNVANYFLEDDLTLGNLECVLQTGGVMIKENGFSFKCDPSYTEILTLGGVDVLTLANNHINDYGRTGLDSTIAALEDADLVGVQQNKNVLVTTDSGLNVGVTAFFFQTDLKTVEENVAELREKGAEVIVALIHWGSEGSYRVGTEQEKQARGMIDAGVDILCGSHPHVLQKLEDYNGGAIYYSLANFCFGGNHYPSDMDTAIIQQQVIRHPDGTIELGERTIIPCCVSSLSPRNNFQPTPYPEDHEAYQRVLSKLEGSYQYNGYLPKYPW